MKCKYDDPNNPAGPCSGEIKERYAMTAYSYTEEDRKSGKEDPNASFFACESCYQEYRSYWSEMWGEYYSAVGYPQCNPYSNDDIHEPTVVDEFRDFISDPEDR